MIATRSSATDTVGGKAAPERCDLIAELAVRR